MKEESDKNEKLAWHCLEHENHKECVNECKVQQALILLGKKYLMPLIRILLLNDILRFNEILDQINGSPKTIAARLRELENYCLINTYGGSSVKICEFAYKNAIRILATQ